MTENVKYRSPALDAVESFVPHARTRGTGGPAAEGQGREALAPQTIPRAARSPDAP
jgi:hypothetical protein